MLKTLVIVVCLVVTVVAWSLFFRMIGQIVRTVKVGQPAVRNDQPGQRTATLLREFLGHTRMKRLPVVALAHWVTMIGFLVLFLTLITAHGQIFNPDFALPLIGHFFLFEWVVEFLTFFGWFAIVYLIVLRQVIHPRSRGHKSRFFGSVWWQAYYVEYTILGVMSCIFVLRALEYARLAHEGKASVLHFPFTFWLGNIFSGASMAALGTAILLVAALKLLISYAWMITVATQPTMGVAWHRFLAFFNIWFKRHPSGRTSLGALQPIMIDGKPLDFEEIEDMDEDASLGVGKVEDFTWKGLLDFTTCTECGRCQSQCPAWNTEKPLSPKLLMMGLREHAHAKAPWLQAAEDTRESLGDALTAVAEKPLIGATGYTMDDPRTAYNAADAVVDPDALWACTTCGACVEQCPVDIEHVDHIVDMRRNQVLMESAFPTELAGLFKNLEKNSNPWGMAPRLRMDWAKKLDFEVKQVGADVEDLSEVEYLFWVGCAGAFEDRAKATTAAVAELLHTAGVEFAVLGDGESCTGDPARRSGNEFLYQMLAMANVEMLGEINAKKIVVTCAHCFNTISNEYKQLGANFEVVHHTQLLNKLVREKRLTLVAPADGGGAAPVTYHDPCYLGRHNHIYEPPRELIQSIPGLQLTEMPRHGEKSFCCGAGGARMWMEEKIGSRINENRTAEAVATGAKQIAVACPFCRVMLADGLTAAQASNKADEDVSVVDVAQLLLASVKRGQSS